MNPVSWAKKELARLKIKSINLLLPRIASVKFLSFPRAHEVELAADLQCTHCQNRVADLILKLDDVESVVVDPFKKKVMLIRKPVNDGSSRRVAADYSRTANRASRTAKLSS